MLRCGLLLVLLSLIPAAAAAGKLGPREEAEILLRAGNALHDRGNYRGALSNYHEARRIFPSYKIDFNIGVTLMAMGRAIQAAQQFERFLLTARKVAEPAMKQEAQRRLDRLRSRLGSVVVVCPVPGAVVAVEGAEVGRTPLEGRLYLRPGAYAITVTAEGRRPFRQQLTPGAGSLLTLFVPWRQGAAPPQPVPAYNARPRRDTTPLDVAPAPAPPPERRAGPFYTRWWFWTVVGAVVAGSVTAAVLVTREPDGREPRAELGTIP